MTMEWYVLKSKPNKEEALYKQVALQGYEIFYPRQATKPVNPRAQKIKSYFAGYMFININLQETGLSIFQWMPYSTGLVNFDGEPAVIPINIMQILIKSIDTLTQNEVNACNEFLPDNPLKIINGPFAGYEAIFDTRLAGNDRIRILLTLAKGNWMPLELPASYVERKNQPVNFRNMQL